MPKWMTLFVVTFAISGCATFQKPEPMTNAGACASFSIIRPSRSDTEETKKQVLAHNRVYRITCESK
jgi:hypothetical protein